MTGDSTIAGAIGAMPTARATHESSQQAVSAVPVGVTIAQIGNATLYLGDARGIIPALSGIDVVVGDPPYGVLLGQTGNGNARTRKRGSYGTFEDTPENVRAVCVPVIADCIAHFGRVVITPGQRCAWDYPKPDDIGTWFNPGGSSAGKWGWLTGHLILYYGRDPRAGGRITASSTTGYGPLASDREVQHPCPKPLCFMEWLVVKASLPGETVLDPFMGSGTTGVACMALDRPFVGIEVEERYFDVACKRIEDAQRQGSMFGEAAA